MSKSRKVKIRTCFLLFLCLGTSLYAADSARGGGDNLAKLFIKQARTLSNQLRELITLAHLQGEDITDLLTDSDIVAFNQAVKTTPVATSNQAPLDRAGFEVDAAVIEDPLNPKNKMISLYKPFWASRLLEKPPSNKQTEISVETNRLILHEYLRIIGKNLEENTFQIVLKLENEIDSDKVLISIGNKMFLFGPPKLSFEDATDYCSERAKIVNGFTLVSNDNLLDNRNILRRLLGSSEKAKQSYWTSSQSKTTIYFKSAGPDTLAYRKMISLADDSAPEEVEIHRRYTDKKTVEPLNATLCILYLNAGKAVEEVDLR